MTEITRILSDIDANPAAAEQLLPLVYEELRRLAAAKMARESPGQTLSATALVHEAYLRVVDGSNPPQFDGRGHFFAAAAEAMRRILIERARRKRAVKHGGERQRLELDPSLAAIRAPCDDIDDLLALNDALDRLGKEDPSLAQLVKLSFFVGMSIEEAAEAMGISRATAYRQWVFARAWLHDAMTGEDSK